MNLLPTRNLTTKQKWTRQPGEGKVAGAGGNHLTHSHMYTAGKICRLYLSIQHSFPIYRVLSGRFSLACVLWRTHPVNPWLHHFPPCVTVLFHYLQDLQPDSRVCEVRWRERYRPLLHAWEDKSTVRHGCSTSLRWAAEDLCTRKVGWPWLLRSRSSQLLPAPVAAQGWERGACNSVHP